MCGSGSTKVLNTDPIRIRIHNTGFLQSLFSPQLYSRVTWAVLPGVVHWSIPNGSGDLTGVPNGLVVPTWMNSHLKWLYVCPLGNKNKKLSLWPYFIIVWNFYYLSILFETSDSFKSNCPPPPLQDRVFVTIEISHIQSPCSQSSPLISRNWSNGI